MRQKQDCLKIFRHRVTTGPSRCRHARRRRPRSGGDHRRCGEGGARCAAARSARSRNRRLRPLRLRAAMPRKSFRHALNEALKLEMRRDDRVIIMGEDVTGGAGASGEKTPGAARSASPRASLASSVRSASWIQPSPRARSSCARRERRRRDCGRSPSIMFVDFLGVCFDQMFNQAASSATCSAAGGNADGGARDVRRGLTIGEPAQPGALSPLHAHSGAQGRDPLEPYDAKGC